MMSANAYIHAVQDLEQLYQTFLMEKDRNSYKTICIRISEYGQSDERIPRLLWNILSHPYSKIREIHLYETNIPVELALSASTVTPQIRKWCQMVPATVPRKLWLNSSEENRQVVSDLRAALTSPGNRVEEVIINSAINGDEQTPPFDLLVRPVLQSPHNDVRMLVFTLSEEVNEATTRALSLGLISPNCKVRTFDLILPLEFQKSNGHLPIFDGLCGAHCLEEFRLIQSNKLTSPNAFDDIVVLKLSYMMERPGNRLSSLDLCLGDLGWNQNHVSILTKSITSEHCRVESLQLTMFPQEEEDFFLPLVIALRHSNNRLRSLKLKLWGERTASSLIESLNDRHCKVESLTLGNAHESVDERVVLAIADVLRTSSSNRLRKLVLGRQSTAVFSAFAESLRSRNNKLTDMSIRFIGEDDDLALRQFKSALRISNVRRVAEKSSSSFYIAFNAPFFHVLHTLLSLKHVPRLGEKALVRLLPLQNFIIRVAETLGWPLKHLRLLSE